MSSDAEPVKGLLFGRYQPDGLLRGWSSIPDRPDALSPGEYFPIAVWKDQGRGAVAYVYRNEDGDYDSPEDEYEIYVEWRLHQGDKWIINDDCNYATCWNPWDATEHGPILGLKQIQDSYEEERVWSYLGGFFSPEVKQARFRSEDGQVVELDLFPAFNGFVVGLPMPPAWSLEMFSADGAQIPLANMFQRF